jgi:hypothetical protein
MTDGAGGKKGFHFKQLTLPIIGKKQKSLH